MAQLSYLAATASPEAIAAAVTRDGAVVLERAIYPHRAQAALDELLPFSAAAPVGRDKDSGYRTTRTGALIARSAACRELVMQATILGACDAFLLPNCKRYQLHLSQVIRIMPDQPTQFLHRDRLVWGQYLRGLEPQLSTMWALTEFTRENGATRVVPGSAAWPEEREASPADIACAEMAPGSVLVYSGSVLHGGGANTSSADRVGLNIGYSLGWLRQEENQYLSCPPELAKDFAPELQELLGYTMMGDALGYFTPPLAAEQEAGLLPPELALGRQPRKEGRFV